MSDECREHLSLILPGDEAPTVFEVCEKQAGHRDHHGTLTGYCWWTTQPARPIQKIGYPVARSDEQIRSNEMLAKAWSTVGPRFNRAIDLATQGLTDAESEER